MGEFPSGQRGQTVNLLLIASVVRIHLPPPNERNPNFFPVGSGFGFFLVILGIFHTEFCTSSPTLWERLLVHFFLFPFHIQFRLFTEYTLGCNGTAFAGSHFPQIPSAAFLYSDCVSDIRINWIPSMSTASLCGMPNSRMENPCSLASE